MASALLHQRIRDLDGKPGLISEALVRLPSFSDPAELYVCDAFYNATHSIANDLKLLARFAVKLLVEFASVAKIRPLAK